MKIIRCPFCGGEVSIGICDDEGNQHESDYEENPWSGLGFQFIHNIDNGASEDCPIATYEDEILGRFIYDSRQEAQKEWNKRYDKNTNA